jgi:hypothetical protein
MAVDKDGWEVPDGPSTNVDSEGWEVPAAQKKSFSETDDYAGRHLRAGIAAGAKNLARGAQFMAGGIASAGHKMLGGDGTFGDPLFEGMKSSDAYWDSHIQNEVGDVDSGVGGLALQAVGQIPSMANLPMAAMAATGIGSEQGTSILDEGGDMAHAAAAMGFSQATNTALFALPASVRGPILQRILSGGALGAFETYLEPAVVNQIRKEAELKEREMPGWKDYVVGTVMGGTVGGAFGGRPAPKTPKTPDAPDAATPPGGLALVPKGDEPGPTPPPEAPVTRDLLSLTDEADYPVNDGGTRAQYPTDVSVRMADARSGDGRNPAEPFVFEPSGMRTKQGMDADVPTIDFPLRQEVLQRPEVKGAITRFRKRAEEASSETARLKVEDDFARYMRRYGIGSAEDAHGLRRALYEPELRDPMAIRKGGELELAKTETDIPAVEGTPERWKGADPVNTRPDQGAANARESGKSEVESWKQTKFHVGEDGVIDLKRTLANVLSTGTSRHFFPGYQQLAVKLLKHLDASGLRVRIGEDLRTAADGSKELGVYRQVPHEIVLRKDAGNSDYVLMHELVHAATARWIKQNPGHKFVTELEALRQRFIKKHGETEYGVKDVDEFISEAYTNPNFQKFLKKQDRTLWERIKATVMNIMRGEFALVPKEFDALKRTLDLADKIMVKNEAAAYKFKRGTPQLWDGVDRRTRTALEEAGASNLMIGKLDDAVKSIYTNRAGKPFGEEDLKTLGIVETPKAVRAAVKNPSKSNSPLATPEKRVAAYSKIPGVDMSGYITPDVPVADVKAMSMKNPDADIKGPWWLISGKEMMAALKSSPEIYAIGSWFTNARKRADLYYREQLHPLHKDINRLFKNEKAADLMNVMREEAKNKRRYTDQELKSRGYSDEQVSAYSRLRQELDAAIERENKALRDMGEEEITSMEAYYSSRWSGDWKTPVFDKSGRIIWYIAEHSKAKAEHALAYLAKQYPDLDIKKSKVFYAKNRNLTESYSHIATYREMVRILGENDPVTQGMKYLWENKIQQEGQTALGQNRHFEPKHGVRGHLGDRPWMNDKRNVSDFFEAQMAYLRNAHTWAEMQTAVKNTNELLHDADMQQNKGNLLELSREILRTELGGGTIDAVSRLEKTISGWAGQLDAMLPGPLKGHISTDLGSLHTGIGKAKWWFYTSKLGLFNFPFAVTQLVQPIFTLPHHHSLTLDGYKHNMFKTTLESGHASTIALLKHYGEKTSGRPYDLSKSGLSKTMQDAIMYVDANSLADLNQYAEVGHVSGSPGWQKAKEVMGYSISEPERVARTGAFMAFVSHLKQSGKFDNDMAIFAKAEELTNLSMANYRHTERAPIFNRIGMTGNALATLQTFKINQLNQLKLFYNKGRQSGDWTPLAGMLAIQFALAGTAGMYGIDTADDILDFLIKQGVDAGLVNKDVLEFGIKKSMLANWHPGVSTGVFSQAMGQMNFQAKMDAGTLIEPGFENLVPFVADYGHQIAAFGRLAQSLARGENPRVAGDRAVHAIMPSTGKSFYEMIGGFGGTMTNSQGAAFPISDPSQPVYQRTEGDKVRKFMGMSSIDEAMAKEQHYQVKNAEGRVNAAQEVQSKKIKEGLMIGDADQIKEGLLDYAVLGGDVDRLLKSLDDVQFKRYVTAEQEMFIKGPKTPQQAEKMRRYLEATKQLRR